MPGAITHNSICLAVAQTLAPNGEDGDEVFTEKFDTNLFTKFTIFMISEYQATDSTTGLEWYYQMGFAKADAEGGVEWADTEEILTDYLEDHTPDLGVPEKKVSAHHIMIEKLGRFGRFRVKNKDVVNQNTFAIYGDV